MTARVGKKQIIQRRIKKGQPNKQSNRYHQPTNNNPQHLLYSLLLTIIIIMAPHPTDDDFLQDGGEGLNYYYDDLNSQLKKLRRKVKAIDSAKASDKASKVKDAEKVMNSTQEAMNLFQSSLNQADASEKRQYTDDFEKLKKSFNKLKTQLDGHKSGKSSDSAARNELLNDKESGGGSKDGDGGGGKKKTRREKKAEAADGADQVQVQTFDKHTQEVIDLQQRNLDKLEELIELNEDTIQIGQKAAARLKAQTEKLHKIQAEVDEIGTGLKRAKKEMASLYRNIVCSKVIILIIIIVMLLIVAAIVLRVILEAFGIKVLDANSIISNIKSVVKKNK